MSDILEPIQLATARQSEEIAGLISDVCRNPEFEASTGIDTHAAIFSIGASQLRVGTLSSPFETDRAVDCMVTSREQVESDESTQLVLQTDFTFLSWGFFKRRFSASVLREYYTLEHDDERLVPISKPLIIPYGTPRHERKELQAIRKEIEALTAAVQEKKFLVGDYEKLKENLGKVGTSNLILCGEGASVINLPMDRRW